MYAPATPSQSSLLANLGLPIADNRIRFYLDTTADGDTWELEYPAATETITSASRWSDHGPDYRTSIEQVTEEGTGLRDLNARLGALLYGDELADDGLIEVTLSIALQIPAQLIAA